MTGALASAMGASGLTGFTLDEVVVSLEDDLLSSGRDPLAEGWRRLVPHGASDDDLTIEGASTLLVSEAAFDLLRQHRLDHAEITWSDRSAPLSGAMRTYLARRGLGPDAAGTAE